MIIICRDSKDNFHLVRYIEKDGLSMRVSTYCGIQGLSKVDQLPDGFIKRLGCEGCEKVHEETLAAATR